MRGSRLQIPLYGLPASSHAFTRASPIRRAVGSLAQVRKRSSFKRYQAGAGVCELAARFRVHRDTVSDILRRLEVLKRPRRSRDERLGEMLTAYQSGSSLATDHDRTSAVRRSRGGASSAVQSRSLPTPATWMALQRLDVAHGCGESDDNLTSGGKRELPADY